MKYVLIAHFYNYPCACGFQRIEKFLYETVEEAKIKWMEIKKYYPDSYGWIADAVTEDPETAIYVD